MLLIYKLNILFKSREFIFDFYKDIVGCTKYVYIHEIYVDPFLYNVQAVRHCVRDMTFCVE